MERKLIRNNYAKMPPLEGTRLETADSSEMDDLLELKVIEELNELSDAIATNDSDAIAEEAADSIEAILARAALYGISHVQIENQMLIKRAKFGGFEDGLVLVSDSQD